PRVEDCVDGGRVGGARGARERERDREAAAHLLHVELIDVEGEHGVAPFDEHQCAATTSEVDAHVKFAVQSCAMTRTYEKKKRAEREAATRQRIVEATVDLHTSV